MDSTKNDQRFLDLARAIGPHIAEHTAAHDDADTFVTESFLRLRDRKMFSSGIPEELGGGGMTHRGQCELIRALAQHCSATALAYSMHAHPVALQVFKYRCDGSNAQSLERLARGEQIVCGTGASDWLASSGSLTEVEEGYRAVAHKRFVSGAPAAHVFVSSARLEHPDRDAEVLHFAIPMSSPGLRIEETWRAHGMRGTGSHDVHLEGVLVPAEAVKARRPAGVWHPLWSTILPVALPLIMAAYVGVAERAAREARAAARRRPPADEVSALLGELENEMLAAELALERLIAGCDEHRFTPSLDHTSATLAAKSLVARAVEAVVDRATRLAGGAGYIRSFGLERLLRDVRAVRYHPLPIEKQVRFTGRVQLGLDPA